MVPGLTFALPAVDGPEVRLSEVVGAGPAVLVFVHADCPTSLLALRRLPAETPLPLLVIAQDSLPEAARLARRARVQARVLVDAPPYAVSRAWDVTTVPTAVRVEQGGIPGAPGRGLGPGCARSAARGAARRRAAQPQAGLRLALDVRRARRRAGRAGGHVRTGLERRPAGRAADTGAGGGHAGRTRSRPLAGCGATGRRRGHARAGCRLRGAGGLPAGALPAASRRPSTRRSIPPSTCTGSM